MSELELAVGSIIRVKKEHAYLPVDGRCIKVTRIRETGYERYFGEYLVQENAPFKSTIHFDPRFVEIVA